MSVRLLGQTVAMAAGRTNRPFAEEVRRLLIERKMSTRALAERAGISQPYLSRLLRQADYKKTPSPRVARAVAEALDKPPDYFAEFREALVIERVRSSQRLRDRLYDDLFAGRKQPT